MRFYLYDTTAKLVIGNMKSIEEVISHLICRQNYSSRLEYLFDCSRIYTCYQEAIDRQYFEFYSSPFTLVKVFWEQEQN